MKYITIIFDNSPLSRLLEETPADRDAILKGLRTFALLRVTGMNVIETANIQDSAMRTEKIRLLCEITKTMEPYQTPNELLADIARAYETKAPLMLGDRVSWFAIHNPQEVTDALSAESLKWHQDRENSFREQYEKLRARHQPLFASGSALLPRNCSDLLKYFIEHRETYYDILLLEIYELQTGHRPSHEELSRFLDSSNTRGWALVWLARVYAMHARSIRSSGYGWKVNAGMHDLDSAIYLPYCDWFVTGDAPQRRAFRLLNARNSRNTRIVDYAAFRSKLLIG